MKYQSLLFTFVLSLSGLAGAQFTPNCQLPEVFCLDEFNDFAANQASIESMVEGLPAHVRRNSTFKRGNNIQKNLVGIHGPHGHKAPGLASGSSSPDKPRVIVWDESSGFTASWNSGDTNHAAHDRVDLYDFDFEKNEHRLTAWFPKAVNGSNFHDAHFVDSGGRTCTKCHGEVQRPIFPMYPDWPQFYGEFNDEMTGYAANAGAIRRDLKTMANQFQPIERGLYLDFLDNEGSTNKRYTPLFTSQITDNNTYHPYRPNTSVTGSHTSRAFFHRPNLRLGIVYNRLTALQTFEKIKKSPIFKKFPDVVFYSLLDCNWDYVEGAAQGRRGRILDALLAEAHTLPGMQNINLRGARFADSDLTPAEKSSGDYYPVTSGNQTVYYKHNDYKQVGYKQIPYEDLLQLLGLKIEDLDIRFRHDSSFKVDRGFGVYDSRAYYHTDNAMDIGYLNDTYAMNPECGNFNNPMDCNFSYNGTYMEGMKYFNSYFDGASTTNELLVAQMLIYLTDQNQDFSNDPDLDEVRTKIRERIPNPRVFFETLRNKYSHHTNRLALDATFFDRMDTISPWIQLPYPPHLARVHNRESYWSPYSGTTCSSGQCLRHAQWTSRANRLDRTTNREHQGNNLCWSVYKSLLHRY